MPCAICEAYSASQLGAIVMEQITRGPAGKHYNESSINFMNIFFPPINYYTIYSSLSNCQYRRYSI